MMIQSVCSRAPADQLVGLVAQAASSQAALDEQPADNSTEFKPVQGGGNIASGEVLLVEAYAAMWLLALGLVLLTILKQAKLDARIVQLAADIERARRAQDGQARGQAAQPEDS